MREPPLEGEEAPAKAQSPATCQIIHCTCIPLCSVPMLSTHSVLLLVACWTVEEGGPEQGETTAAVAAGFGARRQGSRVQPAPRGGGCAMGRPPLPPAGWLPGPRRVLLWFREVCTFPYSPRRGLGHALVPRTLLLQAVPLPSPAPTPSCPPLSSRSSVPTSLYS